MSVVDVFQGFNPSKLASLACRSKKTTAKVNPTFLRALTLRPCCRSKGLLIKTENKE